MYIVCGGWLQAALFGIIWGLFRKAHFTYLETPKCLAPTGTGREYRNWNINTFFQDCHPQVLRLHHIGILNSPDGDYLAYV